MTYPVALAFAVVFNAAAVLSLRRQSWMLNPSGEENAKQRSAAVVGSDNSLKGRAAIGLQRASIALAALFAITSAPLQIATAIQCLVGIIINFGKFFI